MNRRRIRRIWVYMRSGNATYLSYIISTSNTVLIFWGLGLSNIPWVTKYLHLWQFALLFIMTFLPLAILLGHWHYRTQMPIETDLQYTNSPIMMQLVNDVKEIKEQLKKKAVEE